MSTILVEVSKPILIIADNEWPAEWNIFKSLNIFCCSNLLTRLTVKSMLDKSDRSGPIESMCQEN